MDKELNIEQLDLVKNKVLRSIIARLNKFWNGKVMLSRHEHQKFNLSDWKLRSMLRILRRNWLLTTWWEISNNFKKTNTYTLSEKLINYIYTRLKITASNFDIVSFSKNCSVEKALLLLWVVENKRYLRANNVNIISTDKYKYKYNKQKNIITRYSKTWKDTKWFNLFNWIKELFGYSNKELINKIA